MPDYSWSPRSPLQKAIAARPNAKSGEAGVRLTELRDFDLVQVMARRGKWTEVAATSKARLGVPPPHESVAVTAPGVVLVWSGPDQFLTLSNNGRYNLDTLKQAFGGIASLSDQSSGRVLVQVSGLQTRAMLAKLSSVDLDARAFPIGMAAATSIDHTGVNLWRALDAADGEPVFCVLVLASYADSLWHAFVDASAEYGIELLASGFDLETVAPARHSVP